MNNECGLLELIMFVKDSKPIITDTLKAIKPYIDHWTIVDIGSTDGTQDAVRDLLSDVPGELIERKPSQPNITPGMLNSGRYNELLKELNIPKSNCQYSITLDDTYVLHGGKELREKLKTSIKTGCAALKVITGHIYSYSYRILKIEENNGDTEIIELPNVYIKEIINTYTKHRALYESIQEIKYISNYVGRSGKFQLAKLYYKIGEHGKALDLFQNIRFKEDQIISRFKNSIGSTVLTINNNEQIGSPPVGNESNLSKEEYYLLMYYTADTLIKLRRPWKESEDIYIELTKSYPHRAESFYRLARAYEQIFDNKKALEYIKQAFNLPLPSSSVGAGGSEIEYKLYKIEIPYLMAKISMQLDEFGLTKKAMKRGLGEDPDDQRFYTIFNAISDCSPRDAIVLNKKVVVFHVGNEVLWNPCCLDKCTNSEILIMNLARELATLGYQVFIFGLFTTPASSDNGPGVDQGVEVDLQGEYSNVEYIDYTRYNEFCESYKIDTLIVYKHTRNLVFYENISKVYLWMDEVTDNDETFHTHKTKFKGMICMSKEHKKQICQEFKYDENSVFVTHNAAALITSKVTTSNNNDSNKRIIKFIYSTNNGKINGLKNLVNMFPVIHKRYPKSELNIYANETDLTPYILSAIREMKEYVHLHPVHGNLCEAYQNSDVWLYPSSVSEVYCPEQLLAQSCGVLCVSTSVIDSDCGSSGSSGSGCVKVPNENVDAPVVQDIILKKLFSTLDNHKVRNMLINKARKWADTQTYQVLAEEWVRDIL